MLAVVTTAATKDLPLVGRRFKLCFGKDGTDRCSIFLLKAARIWSNAFIDGSFKALVDLEQLGNEAPVPVEPFGHPAPAFLGSIAKADRPFGRKLAMIGDFLHCLVREFAKEAIARLLEPMEKHVLPGGIEQVPRDRLGKVAVRLLDKEAVPEVENVAVKGELIAVTRFAKQKRRLADEIERKVGKADVDFQHRGVSAPFAKPLTKHQGIIAKAQKIVEAHQVRRVRFRAGSHQMCFTSSGMS